uniref:Secreted protein n=1 Tax=Mesocestoides corti TaxID=53468 RepID=A0A5K3G4L5_MESCO
MYLRVCGHLRFVALAVGFYFKLKTATSKEMLKPCFSLIRSLRPPTQGSPIRSMSPAARILNSPSLA